ncbi:DUF4382 domain-containing protein [Flavihumibacter sp. R14]|nr:DUF4382 domain-containing protein [Flavihumibacter soli]
MKTILSLCLLFLLSSSVISCKDSGSSTVTRFNVKMTDAPGNYDALYLSLKEVQVLTSEGRRNLEVKSDPFDILRFRMGKDTLIAAEDISSGELQEIRLVLNETGNAIVVDGETHELKTPSGQSSGIKIKVNDELVGGIAYTLTLDFDAAKSVVHTGNGKYILKPVIRAIPRAVSGALTGTVSPVASNPKVYAITGLDTVGAVADANGRFFFPGISEGNYKVNIEPVSPFKPLTIENVEVTKSSVKDLGIIIITPL